MYTPKQLIWMRKEGYDDEYDTEAQVVILSYQKRTGLFAPHGLGISCKCSAGAGCREPAECVSETAGVFFHSLER